LIPGQPYKETSGDFKGEIQHRLDFKNRIKRGWLSA